MSLLGLALTGSGLLGLLVLFISGGFQTQPMPGFLTRAFFWGATLAAGIALLQP